MLATPITATSKERCGLDLAARARFPSSCELHAVGGVCDNGGMAEIPAEIVAALKTIDDQLADGLTKALDPVAGDLGPREIVVIERLVNGVADGAPASELNAFVRLLPVTVSRAVQPAIDVVTAG